MRAFHTLIVISIASAWIVTGCATPSGTTRTSAPPAAPATTDREDFDHPDEPKDVRIGGAPSTPGVLRGAGPEAVTAALGEKVWYGLLHAHTYFSDGSGTPAQAYARAKQKKVDFFAVTEHNHSAAEAGAKERADTILIATNHDLYTSSTPVSITRKPRDEAEETVEVSSVMSAARAATDAGFVAMYGQEFSTISSGNHVNVLRIDEVLTVANGNFKSLYSALDAKVAAGAPPPVVQMNHPNFVADLFLNSTAAKQKANDYGIDDYGGDFAALVAASDRYVALIELLSGPAMEEESRAKYNYGGDNHERDYFYYLSQGYHLSPSVGHDNHYVTWGDSTPARMGVYAPSRTEDALYRAMRENRTFATEDTDLRVQFRINGQPMGSIVTTSPGQVLKLELSVQDPTDPSAEYDATLMHGFVEPQHKGALQQLDLADGEVQTYLVDTATVTLDDQHADGGPEFFYVRIKQHTDGDRAWTAPIWINYVRNRN